MPMQRYTIDPANFTDGQWEELYNASTIMPRTMEARHTARAFKRPRKYIQLAILACQNCAEDSRDRYDDELQAKDLEGAAERLQALIGPDRISRRAAQSRLWDLLMSDIYTDAPEYADRVEEIHALAEIVFAKPQRRKARA